MLSIFLYYPKCILTDTYPTYWRTIYHEMSHGLTNFLSFGGSTVDLLRLYRTRHICRLSLVDAAYAPNL